LPPLAYSPFFLLIVLAILFPRMLGVITTIWNQLTYAE
jgi:hypothetical protein